jgi:aspartate carbamoyltransferase catalytic subunit
MKSDELIKRTKLKKERVELLLKEAQELTAIFAASRKTASSQSLKIIYRVCL